MGEGGGCRGVNAFFVLPSFSFLKKGELLCKWVPMGNALFASTLVFSLFLWHVDFQIVSFSAIVNL